MDDIKDFFSRKFEELFNKHHRKSDHTHEFIEALKSNKYVRAEYPVVYNGKIYECVENAFIKNERICAVYYVILEYSYIAAEKTDGRFIMLLN